MSDNREKFAGVYRALLLERARRIDAPAERARSSLSHVSDAKLDALIIAAMHANARAHGEDELLRSALDEASTAKSTTEVHHG